MAEQWITHRRIMFVHMQHLYNLHNQWLDWGDRMVTQAVKNLAVVQKTCVRILSWDDPPEKGMPTHSSILAWRIPWIETGRLLSMGLQSVRHYWATFTFHQENSMDYSQYEIFMYTVWCRSRKIHSGTVWKGNRKYWLEIIRLPGIFPAKMGLFGISRALQFGVCNHGKPQGSVHMSRENKCFCREEKEVGRAAINKRVHDFSFFFSIYFY